MGDGDVSNMVREIKQQRSESHERDENAEKIGSKPEQFWNRPPASEGESILQVTASLLSEGAPPHETHSLRPRFPRLLPEQPDWPLQPP